MAICYIVSLIVIKNCNENLFGGSPINKYLSQLEGSTIILPLGNSNAHLQWVPESCNNSMNISSRHWSTLDAGPFLTGLRSDLLGSSTPVNRRQKSRICRVLETGPCHLNLSVSAACRSIQ